MQKKRRINPADRAEISQMITDRQEVVFKIQDLKHEVQKMENLIKNRLINTGQVEILSINWRLLQRAYP